MLPMRYVSLFVVYVVVVTAAAAFAPVVAISALSLAITQKKITEEKKKTKRLTIQNHSNAHQIDSYILEKDGIPWSLENVPKSNFQTF